jgi:hypothetical protein
VAVLVALRDVEIFVNDALHGVGVQVYADGFMV